MLLALLKRIESSELRKRVQATGQGLEDIKVVRKLANVDEVALCQDVVKCLEFSPRHMRLFWAGVISTLNVLLETEDALIKEAKAMSKQIDVYVDAQGKPCHLAIPNEQAQHLGAEKQGDAWRTVCNNNPGQLTVTKGTPEAKLPCPDCQDQLDMWKDVQENNE